MQLCQKVHVLNADRTDRTAAWHARGQPVYLNVMSQMPPPVPAASRSAAPSPDPAAPAKYPWLREQIIPWATSLTVHAIIIVVALLAVATVATVTSQSREIEQVRVPTATLATDGIGGVPNVGNMNDVTSQNASLNPVADSTNPLPQGEGSSVNDLLETAGGSANPANSVTGITGMGAISDAIGGGGGEGASLFGEPGGGGGFMGIDIGTPGSGGNNRRIIFVCDSSGSMEGEAKFLLLQELRKAIEPLVVEQSFNIIFFSGERFPSAFPDGLKPATRKFKGEAGTFLDNLTVGGSTNPIPALEAAFRMKPDLVFFLTDGRFDTLAGYDAVIGTVERLNGDNEAIVNTIQFINRDEEAERVLKKIAFDSGGVYRFVGKDDL